MEPRGVTAEIRERITSGVERARDAVRAVTAAVRERLPGASEREVAQASGDCFVDATERDVAEAGGDAALSPAVREQVVEANAQPETQSRRTYNWSCRLPGPRRCHTATPKAFRRSVLTRAIHSSDFFAPTSLALVCLVLTA